MNNMFDNLFTKIGTIIGTLALSIASFFGMTPELGSQLAVGGETYYLSGSGITSTQTTVNVTKFGYTKPDGTYQKFNMSNFGALGCATIQPGNSSGKQEFVSFTGVTQNSDGTAQLTGVSRGLERTSPYTASTTLQTSHGGGTKLVISNSPPCFYENYVTINNAETISSIKTFASTTAPRYDASYTASGYEFVPFNQLNDVVVGDVGTSTESALGLVELATKSEQAISTASSTAGAPLVLTSREADATYDGAKTNQVVVTGGSNTIDANYIATSSDYTWSGSSDHTGSFTINNASTTIISSATTTIANNVGIATTSPQLNSLSIGNDVYIDDGGLGIGIATTTDDALEVAGNALISGDLNLTGGLGVGYQATTSASFATPTLDGDTQSATAYCTTGYKVVGGGYDFEPGNTNVVNETVGKNYNPDSTSWKTTVVCRASGGCTAGTIQTFAICLKIN